MTALAEVGLTVLTGARALRARRIMSAEGQAILAAHGFTALTASGG